MKDDARREREQARTPEGPKPVAWRRLDDDGDWPAVDPIREYERLKFAYTEAMLERAEADEALPEIRDPLVAVEEAAESALDTLVYAALSTPAPVPVGEALRGALRNVGYWRDGVLCWCEPGHPIRSEGHQGQCVSAREALTRPAPADRGGRRAHHRYRQGG